MRVISNQSFRQLAPTLLWAHEKEVGPRFDREGVSMFQTVWRMLSDGAEAGTASWCALRQGDWVFMPRGQRRQRFPAGTRMLSVGYRMGPEGVQGAWFDRAGMVVLRNCAVLERATARLRQRIQAEAGEQTGMHTQIHDLRCTHDAWLRIHADFHLWLAAVHATLTGHGVAMDEEAEIDGRVHAVLESLGEDPWAADRDPLELARRAGMSRRRLEQLFRGQIGSGIAEHRRRLQVRVACALLDDRSLQVKQVARQLGFASPSAFSTWFRRQSGRSPEAHRRSTPA